MNRFKASDCVSSCVSSKKEGEEDIYIEGIEYDKENKIARIIPDQSADQGELIKGKGRVTQWVDKIDKSFPKKCNGQEHMLQLLLNSPLRIRSLFYSRNRLHVFFGELVEIGNI